MKRHRYIALLWLTLFGALWAGAAEACGTHAKALCCAQKGVAESGCCGTSAEHGAKKATLENQTTHAEHARGVSEFSGKGLGVEEACCGCPIAEGEPHGCGHQCCGSDAPWTPDRPSESPTGQQPAVLEGTDSKKDPVWVAPTPAVGQKSPRVSGGTLRRLARLQRWTI